MSVEVEIPTVLRSYTGGQRSVKGEGADVAALIADLDTRFEGLGPRIVEGREFRKFVNLYLNDEDVRFLDGLATVVSDGDTVTILPAVAGG